MVSNSEIQPATPSVAAKVPSICGDWTLYEYPVVTSTSLIAAGLPAWNAVRADRQSCGRGRFQRNWVSDEGGLWLSAVVPIGPDTLATRALPLAAGLALSTFLSELGLSGPRLRWPNDVLIDNRKLAGLLVDKFLPGLAVIGVGLNVQNRPETADPRLANHTARLADLLENVLPLAELTVRVLRHLRQVLCELGKSGAPALFVRVNELWNPRPVELDLNGVLRRGLFKGVDPQGRLSLADPDGKMSFYDAHEVRHLTET